MFKSLTEAKQFATDKMKKNMLFGTDRFVCDVYCFEPGQTQAPHRHDELGAGEMALAASGQNHGVTNRSQQQLVVLVFITPNPSH
jgi:quercetin dioxygenase-like cupin family protein